jgi:hypothetical protein
MLEGDQSADSSLPPDEDSAAERLREEIKQSLAKGGYMTKLTGNKLTGSTSWKKRYFAISGAVLSYYEAEEGLYDEDADPLGTVSMMQVTKVQVSSHQEVELGNAFDMTVGDRTYVFDAGSEAECIPWMHAVCAANGGLKMEKNSDGEWNSVNPKAKLQQRMSTYGTSAKGRAMKGRRSTAKRTSVKGGKRTSLMQNADITSMPEGGDADEATAERDSEQAE